MECCTTTLGTRVNFRVKLIGTYIFSVYLEGHAQQPLTLRIKVQTQAAFTTNHIDITATDIQRRIVYYPSTDSNESGTSSAATELADRQQSVVWSTWPFGENNSDTLEQGNNTLFVTFQLKPSDLNWKASAKRNHTLAITNTSTNGLSKSIDLEITNPIDENGDIICWFDNEAKQILFHGKADFDWEDEDGEPMEGSRKHFCWYNLE